MAESGKSIMMTRSYSPQYCLFSKDEEKIKVLFEIDPWRLDKIEEFREGKDMWLRVDLCVCEVGRNGLVKRPEWVTVCRNQTGGNTIKVAKSDWVEKILPKLGLRRIRLIEIPVFEVPDEFEEVSECIEGAWKSYLRGDYDYVVIDYKKCLIMLSDIVRKSGYKKIEEKDEEKRMLRTRRSYSRSMNG